MVNLPGDPIHMTRGLSPLTMILRAFQRVRPAKASESRRRHLDRAIGWVESKRRRPRYAYLLFGRCLGVHL